MRVSFSLSRLGLPNLALPGFGQSGHDLPGCRWSNLDLGKIIGLRASLVIRLKVHSQTIS